MLRTINITNSATTYSLHNLVTFKKEKEMIEWYKDKNIVIEFSEKPQVCMRYIIPSMTKQEKLNISKYPFFNRKDLIVKLSDIRKKKDYMFCIPKGYCWDGATIPRLFWRLIGAKTDSSFLIPSMIHDALCEHHEYVDNDRYFADKIFERLLYTSGVHGFNRWLMFHCVDNFQKLCNWKGQP